MNVIEPSQKEICKKNSAIPCPCAAQDSLGLAVETIGYLPIHGLRHSLDDGVSGWFIWCGGYLGEEADFFKPMTIVEVHSYLPEVEKYLALPPGYRFLLAGGFEKVWYDSGLISIARA